MTPPPPPPSPFHESFGRQSIEAPSIDGDNSIGTVVPEDEDYAEIKVAHVDGVIPGTETASSDGHLQRTGELIDAEYTLVRAVLEGYGTVHFDEVTHDLDEGVRKILQVPSITPLNDGSWEILVRHADLPTLQSKLHEMPIPLTLDLKYSPLEPLSEDVECWGLENARKLCALWFLERATRMSQKSWVVAQVYRHALKRERQSNRTRLSGMGPMGDSILDGLQTERRDEDVRKLTRRRLSNSQTGASLRDLFGLGEHPGPAPGQIFTPDIDSG